MLFRAKTSKKDLGKEVQKTKTNAKALMKEVGVFKAHTNALGGRGGEIKLAGGGEISMK